MVNSNVPVITCFCFVQKAAIFCRGGWRLAAGKYFSVLVIFCARRRKNKECVNGAHIPESKKPTAEDGLSA